MSLEDCQGRVHAYRQLMEDAQAAIERGEMKPARVVEPDPDRALAHRRQRRRQRIQHAMQVSWRWPVEKS